MKGNINCAKFIFYTKVGIVQIIFHFLWDHCTDCGIFENDVLLIYTLEGVSIVANVITAYEESQLNRDFRFSNM